MKNEKMIAALQKLDDAVCEIVAEWEHTDLNDTKAIAKFPFNCSMDELNVTEWVEETIAELQPPTYKVIKHEYKNTGGHCMVSIFTVYELPAKRTLYLTLNEESCSLATGNYICYELDYEDVELLWSVQFDMLQPTDDNFEFIRDCYIEYIKNDCKYFKSTYQIPLNFMPDYLCRQLTAEYSQWLEKNELTTVETDGYKIIIDENYQELRLNENEPEAQQCYQMLDYMDDIMNKWHGDNATKEQVEEFYNIKILVGFNGQYTVFDNSAATFCGLQEMLKYIISEQ